MSNDEDKDKVSDAINAAANLVKAVPIYEDAIQPLAKETGKALGTVGKAVNVALFPVKGLVWGYEQIEEWVATKVAKNLKDVPVENIIEPDLSIAGPTIESLKFSGHKEEISDMFAKLLSSSMNSKTSDSVHQSYVEIVRNLNSDEAKLLKVIVNKINIPFLNLSVKEVNAENKPTGGQKLVVRYFTTEIRSSGCQNLTRGATYLDNLKRLGLIEDIRGRYIVNNELYEAIKKEEITKAYIDTITSSGDEIVFDKGMLSITDYGKGFCRICLE